MAHANAPLSAGRRPAAMGGALPESRPIAHVAAETGISRACASTWVNRWRRYGDIGPHDRPSAPHTSPNATPTEAITKIETWRREGKWSAQRITHELTETGFTTSRRTVTRHLARLGQRSGSPPMESTTSTEL